MNYSKKDLAEIFDVLIFSAKKHKNQKRKDSEQTPYINHPLGVANNVALSNHTSVETIKAAILHDVVEDTPTKISEIELRFGTKVAEIVAEVTNNPELSGEDSKNYELTRATTLSLEASLIRISDKIENISDIDETRPVSWSKERKIKYLLWAKNLVNVIGYDEDISIQQLKYMFEKKFQSALDNLN